jgi:hypothetical protein
MTIWILCLLSVVLAGCNNESSQTLANPQSPTLLNVSETIRLEGFDVPLISLTDSRRVTLTVSYSMSGKTPDQLRLMEQIQGFHPPESTWLLLYLHHAAWQYMNEGTLPPGVEIKPSHLPDRGNGKWWFLDFHDTSYGAVTLALKDGTDVLKILPDMHDPETAWIPLTNESYPIWWRQLEDRISLTKKFAPQPTIAPSDGQGNL